jgi:hypothetical protein
MSRTKKVEKKSNWKISQLHVNQIKKQKQSHDIADSLYQKANLFEHQ